MVPDGSGQSYAPGFGLVDQQVGQRDQAQYLTRVLSCVDGSVYARVDLS